MHTMVREAIRTNLDITATWYDESCFLVLKAQGYANPARCTLTLNFDPLQLRVTYDTGKLVCPRLKHGPTQPWLLQEFLSIEYANPDFLDQLQDILHRWVREALDRGHYDIHLKPWEIINVKGARAHAITGGCPARVSAGPAS